MKTTSTTPYTVSTNRTSPQRSVPLQELPEWLYLPVKRAIALCPAPKLVRQADVDSDSFIDDSKGFIDWSAWLLSLLSNDLWRSPDAPLMRLIPDCNYARLSAMCNGTYSPCQDDCKISLARLMICEAGAQAFGQSSLKELSVPQRAVLRATTSTNTKRVPQKLTLMRIIDLCYAVNDLQESLYTSLSQRDNENDQSTELTSVHHKISQLGSLPAEKATDKIEEIVLDVHNEIANYKTFLRWDMAPPSASGCRILCNAFPPILPHNAGEVYPLPITPDLVDRLLSRWLYRFLEASKHLNIWLSIVDELTNAAITSNCPNESDAAAAADLDRLRQRLCKVILRSLLYRGLDLGLRRGDLENILSEQAVRRDNKLTFRRLLDLVTSVAYLRSYLVSTEFFLDVTPQGKTCDIDATCAVASTELARGQACFMSLVRDISELCAICRDMHQNLPAFCSANNVLDLILQLLRVTACDGDTEIDQDRLNRTLSLVASAATVNCKSRLTSVGFSDLVRRGSDPLRIARAFTTFDPNMALRIVDYVLDINQSRADAAFGYSGKVRCELSTYRSLFLYAAARREGSLIPADDVRTLADACHQGCQSTADGRVFNLVGQELQRLRAAVQRGKPLALLLYSGIQIANGELQDGAVLASRAVDSGQIPDCSSFSLWKRRFPASNGPASLTSQCETNEEIGRLVGHSCRARMFDIGFERWMMSPTRSSTGPDMQSVPSFCANDETQGGISVMDAIVSHHKLLRSQYNEFWRRSARVLGRLSEFGAGIRRDCRRAEKFYTTAALLGSKAALMHMGSLYETGGSNVVADGRLACKFYSRCVEVIEQGNCVSDEDRRLYTICCSLTANMYRLGHVVTRDLALSFEIYSNIFARVQQWGSSTCEVIVTYRRDSDDCCMEACVRLEADDGTDFAHSANAFLHALSKPEGLVERDLAPFSRGMPVEVFPRIARRYRAVDDISWWMT